MSDQIQGVIFDMGSTLMYFTRDWTETIQQGAAAMAAFLVDKQIELDEDKLVEVFIAQREKDHLLAEDTQREVSCRQSLQSALKTVEAPAAAEFWVTEAVRSYLEPEEEAWQPFEAARATLKHLYQQGLRLALLSNAIDDYFIQRQVNRMGFRPYLSPAFSSAGLGIRKPDPQPFELIRSGWGLEAEAVLVVGDRLDADVLGAQRAGMRSVLITADEQPGANEPHRDSILPDATIAAIEELPGLIRGWNNGQ